MSKSSFGLPPETGIQNVRLRTRSLEPMEQFLTRILGFQRLPDSSPNTAVFGAIPHKPQILVTEDRSAPLRPSRSLGLHHVALEYPTRQDLARALRRLIESGYPLTGATHHGIAESLYLADPDGNGFELFAAVPPDQASKRGGKPLDLHPLLELAQPDDCLQAPPAGIKINHLHLRAANLASSERFFHEFLGFSVTVRISGAIFLTATQDHHQIAANVWDGYQPAPSGSVGLISYRLTLPSSQIVEEIRQRTALFGYEISPANTDEDQEILRLIDPNGKLLEIEVCESGSEFSP